MKEAVVFITIFTNDVAWIVCILLLLLMQWFKNESWTWLWLHFCYCYIRVEFTSAIQCNIHQIFLKVLHTCTPTTPGLCIGKKSLIVKPIYREWSVCTHYVNKKIEKKRWIAMAKGINVWNNVRYCFNMLCKLTSA